MICIHHNRDLDGFSSGALLKRKFPDAKFIGWDYGDTIPEIPEGEEVIMIDISFPINAMIEIGMKRQVTILDHHISFKMEYDETPAAWDKFLYIYKAGVAACEIGWKYYFPDEKLPDALLLLGEYDTWRKQDENRWNNRILPFQYGMRNLCNSLETFPTELLELKPDFDGSYPEIERIIESGRTILNYQSMIDEKACASGAFEVDFEGYKAICLNSNMFSSITFKSVYNPKKHDLMLGFRFNGKLWITSIYTEKDIDCSAIAKSRGGGGHKMAAGFEAKTFKGIFKKEEVFPL